MNVDTDAHGYCTLHMEFITDHARVSRFLHNLLIGAHPLSFRYSIDSITLELHRPPTPDQRYADIEIQIRELQLLDSPLTEAFQPIQRSHLAHLTNQALPPKAFVVATLLESEVQTFRLESDGSLMIGFSSGQAIRAIAQVEQVDDPWTLSVKRDGECLGTCACDGESVFLQEQLLSEVEGLSE